LRYLRLAKADLLAAVRLIERDRNKKRNDEFAFNIGSLTTKVAMECAAASARHPDPDVLVEASVVMASPQINLTGVLAGHHPTLTEFIRQARNSMDRSLDVCGKENRKRKRSDQTSTVIESIEDGSAQNRLGSPLTFRYTQSLTLLLLGKIHGLYLQALAKLPRDGLRKCHHSSLLKGGYCYGPSDPVSNILLNTIWYGSMFPTPRKFELQFKVDMICTDMLARVEYCSLYGLVALLRTCFPSLTEHDAVYYLLSSDADVHKAIHKAKKHGHAQALCEDNSLHNAYRQAAVASWHPDPDALVEFVTCSFSMESAEVLAIMQQCKLTNGAS
jgi:CO/xanthine dehydrogenase FAD-binding subunit